MNTNNTIYVTYILCGLLLGISIVKAQQFQSSNSTMGLPRLAASSDEPTAGKISSQKFEVDSLSIATVSTALNVRKNGLDIIQLPVDSEFSRPLRAKEGDSGFVSFAVLGSIGSIIDIGGARIGVSESSVVSGYANIVVSSGQGAWVATPLNVPLQRYEGNRMATLPVFTVRLNPQDGVFDLYANAKLLVDGIAYVASSKDREFRLIPGTQGAWLMGLVQSDENPLYIDENQNGVDDDFELAYAGELLAKGAPLQERKALLAEWHATERVEPPPALFRVRPQPDSE